MRSNLLLLTASVILLPGALLAQDHDEPDRDDHAHEAAAGNITVSHPWARAASKGGDTLVFMEFINAGSADILEAVSSEVATDAGIVGVSFAGGASELIPFEMFDIPAGDFDFDPAGAALQLRGLTETLTEGGVFELELTFQAAGTLHVDVEVETADATQHGHAGHSH